MAPELLAALAATCFASGSVVIKLAGEISGMLAGFALSLAISLAVLLALSIYVVDDWAVSVESAMLFATAGIAGPAIGRTLSIRSVKESGSSVAVPAQSSASALWATAAGILVFQEAVDGEHWVALGMIIGGIWSTTRGGSANIERADTTIIGWRPFAVVALPVAAGVSFASADVLRKFALDGGGQPLVGAVIGTGVALGIWVVVLIVTPSRFSSPLSLRSGKWFCVNGLLTAVAQLCLLFALTRGDLSVIGPIMASQPVIVIVLAALLLREHERLRIGSVAGAIMVFLGSGYISLR